jgi:hypothetical protein
LVTGFPAPRGSTPVGLPFSLLLWIPPTDAYPPDPMRSMPPSQSASVLSIPFGPSLYTPLILSPVFLPTPSRLTSTVSRSSCPLLPDHAGSASPTHPCLPRFHGMTTSPVSLFGPVTFSRMSPSLFRSSNAFPSSRHPPPSSSPLTAAHAHTALHSAAFLPLTIKSW